MSGEGGKLNKIVVGNRTEYYSYCTNLVKHISGTFVEMGFGKGESALIFSKLLTRENYDNREMWLFDSFEGFPAPTKEDYGDDNKCHARKGAWKVPMKPAKDIQASHNAPVYIKKGFFEDTIDSYDGGPIAILHLDCDLYSSYKVCLNRLYHQVAKGGIILFDEYKSKRQLENFPGAARAIDEFFEGKDVEIHRVGQPNSDWEKFYMIKGSK
jgi:hypothetical protein